MNIFVERYSVRNFSSKKVDENTLRQILETVRIAPTA
ncbi:MAG: nitroreductase family protein, partial [Clostridia bacterium]|nr:nitroreductase family protein [Clostridia bacterium]